jgi:hypothetical protein
MMYLTNRGSEPTGEINKFHFSIAVEKQETQIGSIGLSAPQKVMIPRNLPERNSSPLLDSIQPYKWD